MTYRHRPLSTILAPAADPDVEGKAVEPAPGVVEPQVDALPDKYRGKTVEQVAEMHQNAEKELGRVRNEVGNYRGLVSDLTALQRTAPLPVTAPQEPLDVSGDEILRDPVAAVNKILQPQLDEQTKQRELDHAERELIAESGALMAQYPDVYEVAATPDFQEFVNRTNSRIQDFNTAANGQGVLQVRAARRLMEDYSDFKQNAGTDKKQTLTPTEIARQATTEGSGPAGAISGKPLLYESEVITLINKDPDKYRSPSYQRELMSAIEEDRYVRIN